MKKWESDIAYLSDYDEEKAKGLRRLDIYTFYFNLNDRNERAERSKPGTTASGKDWP